MLHCPKCESKVKAIEGVRDRKRNETYRHGVCPNCGYEYYSVEFEVEDNEQFQKVYKRLLKKQITAERFVMADFNIRD